MNVYPFSFEAVLYDELSEDNEYLLTSGMGFSHSYGEAAAKIDEYFGNDLVKIKHLELYEENDLLILPREVIRKYANDEYKHEIPCDADGNELTEKDTSL